jgi:alkylation response protein AidB-like acyl-CoA dehydrogenase
MSNPYVHTHAHTHTRTQTHMQDMGPKQGLNGVDNGQLWFSSVRVPRDSLLDKFGTVAPDGTYQ